MSQISYRITFTAGAQLDLAKGVTAKVLPLLNQAVKAIANEAIRRKTGARGLRAVVEQHMLDVMYEIPGAKNIKGCKVTRETIIDGKRPELVYKDPTPVAKPGAGGAQDEEEIA